MLTCYSPVWNLLSNRSTPKALTVSCKRPSRMKCFREHPFTLPALLLNELGTIILCDLSFVVVVVVLVGNYFKFSKCRVSRFSQ